MTQIKQNEDGSQSIQLPVPKFTVGMEVTRYIGADRIMMKMTVDRIEDGLVHCSTVNEEEFEQIPGFPVPPAVGERIAGWAFDEETGIEEDESMQWGRKYGQTGSWIVPEEFNDEVEA